MRGRKREFVCHAITFKRWRHVSKSLSVAPLSFFVSLLVTFSLFSLSLCLLCLLCLVFPLSPSSLKTLPGHYLFILFLLSFLFFVRPFLFHSLPLFSSLCILSFCPTCPIISLHHCPPLCPSSLARLPRSRPVSGAAPCARLRGLTPGQVGVCRARGEVMESVRKAAETVIEEVCLSVDLQASSPFASKHPLLSQRNH